MCLWLSYKKRIWKQIFLFASLKSLKKDLELDPDPLVRGTDPRIRIRTKKSWIPNPD
jgi:hypothetical protein